MKKALLILGNQLFPLKHLKSLDFDTVIMFEDLGLCEHFKYHKHKIIFFLSAMRHYRDELQAAGYKVHYIQADDAKFEASYEEKLIDFLKKNPSLKTLVHFEIEDKFFETRIDKFIKDHKLSQEKHNSPMFFSTRENFSDYLKSVKKPFMKNFYEKERKRLKILIDKNNKPEGGAWSFDAENRKKLPKDVVVPEFQASVPDQITQDVMYLVETIFPDHPGSSENFWIPVTLDESTQWLHRFIAERLELFGAYEDAITDRSDFVFHAVLSPMINAGLLTPDVVCAEVLKAFEKSGKKIPLNSVEGFIRQVMGWREFIRGIYQNYDDVQSKTNFWNHQGQLKDCWYQGTTGIPVLDDAIKKAETWGYNHHIERLMIVSNMMLLSEVHPKQVYKWFMEMFVDSSDWVMGPNVYGMGQFSDGGIFATKPYICGSNYYLKMSHYPKGEWCDVVDGLYWRFIHKHKKFYESNPRMGMMVKILDKMESTKKQRIFKKAEAFIKQVTF
jgi:deoxyribodipyrimidine photolyase-related protein